MTDRLYTWLDVERVLFERQFDDPPPPGIVGFSAYHDCLEVRLRSESDLSVAESFLRDCFGARYRRDKGLMLEALSDKDRILPVQTEIVGDQPQSVVQFRPSFARVALAPDDYHYDQVPPRFSTGFPPLIAFHSFKGGVGRTAHLLALAKILSEREPPARLLLVDADFEAPGLTSLARAASTYGEPTISVLDFLGLVHGDASETQSDAFELTVHRLRSQPLELNLAGGSVEQFLLPAFRDEVQLLRFELRPEHLVQGKGATWRIAEIFARLGKELGVEAVLIDLRAGVTELASPFLFDPRVRRVLVSTLSHQSMDGTRLVLHQLAKLAPPLDRDDLSDPVVVLSFVTEEMAKAPLLQSARRGLQESYPEESEQDVLPLLPRLEVFDTRFASELLVVQSIPDAMNKSTAIQETLRNLADDWVPQGRQSETSQPMPALASNKRLDLAEFAKKLEYAESGEGEGFLPTPQLRVLATRYKEETPMVVVIGAKGSGKTFTYLQFIRERHWSDSVRKILSESPTAGQEWGDLWPLLQPKKLQEKARRHVETCVQNTLRAFGVNTLDAWRLTESQEKVHAAIQEGSDDALWWRRKWFEILADSLRIRVQTDQTSCDKIVEFLRHRGRRLVVAIDGLEELFCDVERRPVEQAAVRALIEDVPIQLREIPNCPLGVVVFVRPDIVRSTIRQNVGQFERQYEQFMLRWDRDQALRLVVWTCQQAGLLPLDSSLVAKINYESGSQLLSPLWGRKLGTDKSREYRSPEFVIDALMDFKGQIQARDLVRFLRHAAEVDSPRTNTDRLLQPAAMRDAVPRCGEAKVQEIGEEISALKAVFDKIKSQADRKIPFEPVELGLSQEDIALLDSNGIVFEDRNAAGKLEYYMPVLFWKGLNFDSRVPGRWRIKDLLRRALSRRNL